MIAGTTLYIVAVLAALIPLADLAAAAFFWSLFLQSKVAIVPGAESRFMTRLLGGRSWLLAMLTAKSLIVALVFVYFAILTGRRILGLPQLPWSPITSAAAIILLGILPIAFAITFWTTRRGRTPPRPPPFDGSD